MGMTIDEIIQGIEVIQAQAEWDYPLDWQIVLDGAIDTMCKYQKIQEIINNAKDSDGAIRFNWLYEQISEVVEDEDES